MIIIIQDDFQQTSEYSKELRQSITIIPYEDSGQTTNLGVLSAYLYTPESCDGLQRHEHVMLPQGVLITVETPMCLNGFR